MIMFRRFAVDRYCRPVQGSLKAKLKKYDTDYGEYFYVSFFDAVGNAYMDLVFEGELEFYVSSSGKYEIELYRGDNKLTSYRTDIQGVE